MSNHTTLETAKCLKAAGFPQPKPTVGQFWVGEDGELVRVARIDRDCIATYENNDGLFHVGGVNMGSSAFAPNATDILKELGENYTLSYLNGYYCQYSNGDFRPFSRKPSVFKHENPAEACALAWLAKKEK